MWHFCYDSDWIEDIKLQYQKRADTAVSTLHLLFRDIPMFSTKPALLEYMEKNYRDSTTNALELAFNSCVEKLRHKNAHEGSYSEVYQANTVTKMREAIDPLTGSGSFGNKPALWPLVREVS